MHPAGALDGAELEVLKDILELHGFSSRRVYQDGVEGSIVEEIARIEGGDWRLLILSWICWIFLMLCF
ncbi:MAG: hypothetical protein D6805_06005 [Planctomycetota bacterium]|nr:MAG: hypothetical protein D6805_06005 [Planctomycetota bacterium]